MKCLEEEQRNEISISEGEKKSRTETIALISSHTFLKTLSE